MVWCVGSGWREAALWLMGQLQLISWPPSPAARARGDVLLMFAAGPFDIQISFPTDD